MVKGHKNKTAEVLLKGDAARAYASNAYKPKLAKKQAFPKQAIQTAKAPKLFPYSATILDPWSIKGVRIPDQNTMPSGVVSDVERFEMTPIINGTFGALACAFRLTNTTSIVKTDAALSSLNAAGTTLTMGAVPRSATRLFTPGAAIASRFRIVSASIAISTTSPLLTTQGRFIVGFTEPGSADVAGIDTLGSVNVDTLLQRPYIKVCPVNRGEVCSVNYRPANEIATEYFKWNDSYLEPVSTSCLPFGQLFVAGFGLNTNTTYSIALTYNMEYLPLVGTIQFLNMAPSYCDLKQLEQAANLDWGIAAFHREDDSVFNANLNSQGSIPSSTYDALMGALSISGRAVTRMVTDRVNHWSRKAVDYGLGYATYSALSYMRDRPNGYPAVRGG